MGLSDQKWYVVSNLRDTVGKTSLSETAVAAWHR